jgi:hypothetical protein
VRGRGLRKVRVRWHRPARGPVRPCHEIALLRKLTNGSKWGDSKRRRSSRVVNLLTPEDPRVEPRRLASRGAAPGRLLSS